MVPASIADEVEKDLEGPLSSCLALWCLVPSTPRWPCCSGVVLRAPQSSCGLVSVASALLSLPGTDLFGAQNQQPFLLWPLNQGEAALSLARLTFRLTTSAFYSVFLFLFCFSLFVGCLEPLPSGIGKGRVQIL